MTDKNPDLEKLIPVDLLPHSDANSPRPPGHDAILDLLAAEPAVFGAPQSDAGDALNYPADVLTSAEPPAIFGPGNTGIMSPNPTFPGIAPPNVPIVSPFVSPSIPGTDETPAAPLSSLPTLDPALFSTQPFLLPPNETVPPTAAESTAPHPSPPSQSIPNSVRDILPLLPDASPDSTTDEAAPWRQPSCAVADLPHVTAVSGTTGNAKFADVAARRLPEITVNLGEGHRMANRVLAAIGQKLEEAAREQCRNEIHRRFSLFRADMRANFR
ncbi:MAG TPA: hypothetical protein VHV55_05990 [Pirellulales bacterium]|jgi:hypothetical protein|nr:hypothetical protein [Pirellulales bacterium]